MSNLNVPKSFVSGDTVSWTDDLSEYRSDVWTLKYDILNQLTKIEIIAQSQADGTHLVSLAPTVTAEYVPGSYSWTAYVSDGVDRYSLDRGMLNIFPDPTQLVTYDGRSWAQQALDAVEAVIGKRATKDQESYSIAGRSLSRMSLKDLRDLRSYLQIEVQSEFALSNPSAASVKKAVVRF